MSDLPDRIVRIAGCTLLVLLLVSLGPGCGIIEPTPWDPPSDSPDFDGDPSPVDDDDSSADDDDDTGPPDDDDTGPPDDDDTSTDDDDTSAPDDDDIGPPGGDPCEGLAICDGFESSSAGSSPDPSLWSIEAPNCSGDGAAIVDDSVAHSGSHSVRFEGSGGYCNHVFIAPTASVPALGSTIHGRFYLRFGQALGPEHVTFAAFHDQVVDKDIRMGGQSEILMWNRELDDATLPVLSPSGIELSVAPSAETWTCVEFVIDGSAGTLETWVDGVWVEGLAVDESSSPDIDSQWHQGGNWLPELVDARFGWESYGGSPADLWFDDIALSSEPIGCMD